MLLKYILGKTRQNAQSSDFSSFASFFFGYRNFSSPMSKRKSSSMASPEKEDRYYTTRGSLGMEENGKVLGLDHHGHAGDEREGFVWPKMFLSLSSKEKEEDFMAMKGCKLPQRPKKRAKLLQRSLLVRSLIQIQLGFQFHWLIYFFPSFDSSIVLFVCVQLVMPGTWLSDLCQERYEVREKKKASKKVRLV